MHNLGLLLKLRADELFRISATRYETNKTKKVFQRIHNGIMLLLAVAVFLVLYGLSAKLASLGFADMLPIMGYILATVVTFLVTVLKMNETLSGNEDAEYLLSMPIPSVFQVATLFLVQYLRNLVYTFLVSAPMGIVYASATGASGKFWVYWLIGEIFTCFPISGIGSLLGMVLALVLSASSKSNLIQSIVSILTTGGAIWLVLRMADKVGAVLQNGLSRTPQELSNEFIDIFVHNYRFARLYQLGIIGMHPGWTGIFIVLSAMWYGFFVFLLTMGYPVIIISLRCPIDYKNYDFTTLKARSAGKGLFFREAQQFFHSRSFFTNSFLGVLLGVLLTLNLFLAGGSDFLKAFGLAPLLGRFTLALPFLLCSFVGLSNTTYASMSLEGKRHWIMETTPMNEGVIRRAKQELNLCLTVPLALVSGTLAALALHPGLFLSILYLLLPLLYAVLTAVFGSVIGERYADYSATSEQQALRQGAPFLLGYLPMVLVPLLVAVLILII